MHVCIEARVCGGLFQDHCCPASYGLVLVADTKVSILLVILVPILSVLAGLLMDCCICFRRYRRRYIAQQRLHDVKQVVNVYNILKRVVRRRKESQGDSDEVDALRGTSETVADAARIGSGSEKKGGWLGKTVSAIVGIKRIVGSRSKGAASVNDTLVGQESLVSCADPQAPHNQEAGACEEITALDGGGAHVDAASIKNEEVPATESGATGLAVAWGESPDAAYPFPATAYGVLQDVSDSSQLVSLGPSLPTDKGAGRLNSPSRLAEVNLNSGEISDFIAPNVAAARQT